MPTIKQGVAANIQRLAEHGDVAAVPKPSVALTAPIMEGRSVLPSRGSYPPNIILATDFVKSTSMLYGRLRSGVLLSSTHPLLAND